jgi:hypothetical protein
MFFNSVPLKKTHCFSITKIRWLILFKEIIAVYSDKHMKPINILCGREHAELLINKADATYSYHWALKG